MEALIRDFMEITALGLVILMGVFLIAYLFLEVGYSISDPPEEFDISCDNCDTEFHLDVPYRGSDLKFGYGENGYVNQVRCPECGEWLEVNQ